MIETLYPWYPGIFKALHGGFEIFRVIEATHRYIYDLGMFARHAGHWRSALVTEIPRTRL